MASSARIALVSASSFGAFLAGSRNLRFDDAMRFAEAFGYRRQRISGSHHIMKHPSVPGLLNLQPDRNGMAKPYQLKQLAGYVERFGLELEE